MTNFDALACRAQTRSEAAINQLFFELFALKTWYFLHDPDSIQQPLILELDNDRAILPAFTDADRAQQWAAQSSFYAPDSESPVMVVSVADCLKWLREGGLAEADRVSSLCFNLDSESFMLPLKAVEQMTIEALSTNQQQWQCKGGITPTFLGAVSALDPA